MNASSKIANSSHFIKFRRACISIFFQKICNMFGDVVNTLSPKLKHIITDDVRGFHKMAPDGRRDLSYLPGLAKPLAGFEDYLLLS